MNLAAYRRRSTDVVVQHTPMWYVALVTVACMLTISSWLIWTILTDGEWLRYQNLPMHVAYPDGQVDPFIPGTPISFKPGDTVPLVVARCNLDTKDRLYSTSRSMVGHGEDGIDHSYVLKDAVVPVRSGCSVAVSLINVVPENVRSRVIEPGIYRIVGLSEVQGNFRAWTLEWTSDEFRVINPGHVTASFGDPPS